MVKVGSSFRAEAELIKKAKMRALEKNISLSRLMSDLIEKEVKKE